MSAFADLLHILVDKSPFHDEDKLKAAHELVNNAESEMGLSQPEPTEEHHCEKLHTEEHRNEQAE